MTVEAFVHKFGLRARETKSGWLLSCLYPDHEDHTPSFSLSTTGLFYCFGCGRRGHFGTLLHDIAGYSWLKANSVWRNMATAATMTTTHGIADFKDYPRYKSIAELGKYDVDWNMGYLQYQYYAKTELVQCPPWAEIFKRGFLPDTLQEFQCGYDEVNQRLVIPLFDFSGEYVGKLLRGLVDGDHKYFYDGGIVKSDLIFNATAVNASAPFVVICEGPLDVMWLAQKEIRPAIALFGTHISDNQLYQLARLHRRYVLLLDGDEAGVKGSLFIGSKLLEAGLIVDVCQIPPDRPNMKDLNREELLTAINLREVYPFIRRH